jgi:hypothetical protein
MAKSNEYDSAHFKGRWPLRGFKKLGERGYRGYKQCVLFLNELCRDEKRTDEEEAYAALLGSHQAKIEAKSSSLPANKVQSTQASLQSKNFQETMRAT